jgi:hypothetical protein
VEPTPLISLQIKLAFAEVLRRNLLDRLTFAHIVEIANPLRVWFPKHVTGHRASNDALREVPVGPPKSDRRIVPTPESAAYRRQLDWRVPCALQTKCRR